MTAHEGAEIVRERDHSAASTNDYIRKVERGSERRVRLAVARKGDVISQGRFIPGDLSSYPGVPVIRLGGTSGPRMYLTHIAIVQDDGEVYFDNGHYDLTWDEAVTDLATR